MTEDDDLISEIVRRVAAALHIDVSGGLLEQIERQVRQTYAGEIVYIAKRRDVSARNAAIRADHASGLGVNALARKYRLSHRQIRRILGG